VFCTVTPLLTENKIIFAVILLANGLLLLAILLNHSFRKRKELLIIGGMAGTDVIYGIGVFFMAIYRAVILWQGGQNDSESAWNCIILPPLFLLEISLQLTGVMNIFLSIDRLIAVAWPAKYRNLDKTYAHKVLVSMQNSPVTHVSIVVEHKPDTNI
jgi:hypothetical protein